MRGRTSIGILILMFGIVYLLQQTGVFFVPSLWLSSQVIWPLILMVIGIFGLGGFRKGRIPWGSLFCVVLGLIYIIKGLDIFPWLNKVGYFPLFWAFLIIFFGFHLIVPDKKNGSSWPIVRIHKHNGHVEKDSEDFFFKGNPKRKERRMIGDVSIGRHPWVLGDMTFRNGIGDMRINLATAHIDDGSYTIALHAFIGDVRIIVPEGLDVCIDAHAALGDIQVFDNSESGTGRTVHMEDLGYTTSSRRCHIVISMMIGDIEVVRV